MSLSRSVILGWLTIRVFAILTKWFSLTRLETRTKESNIYASIWVRKTLMRNESKAGLMTCEVGTLGLSREALSTDQSFMRDLSKSISVGTRKMVIYA